LYYSINNFSSSKHHTVITSVSVGQESEQSLSGIFIQFLTRLQSRWYILIWRLNWGKAASKLIHIVDRTHFLEAVWLRALAFCKLEAAGSS
jgi:hypothetical protein